MCVFCFFFTQEMVDWFNAIRAARFHYLQVAFPGASDEEVRATDLMLWSVMSRKSWSEIPRKTKNVTSVIIQFLLVSVLSSFIAC